MKKHFSLWLLMAAFAFSALGADKPTKGMHPPEGTSSTILKWNTIALETMAGPTYDPMIASRIFAMVHIAMHDAMNSIDPVYDTYLHHPVQKKADPVAAVSAAAYAVLVETFPKKKESLDAALANATSWVKSAEARKAGIDLGTLIGKATVAHRAKDGAFQHPVAEINNPKVPGMYQPVPPTPFVYTPFWATLPTFALESPYQFRVAPMAALASEEYARHFNEVKAKGAKVNSTRTAEETTIAKFWYEFSEIGWNRIAATLAADKNLDAHATARLLALVNMALADSYIAGWDSKFFYNFWRPYTAIRAAATDGNALTTQDDNWEPLLNTPPVQDYPSTHSVLGSAAATVLAELLGGKTAFNMTSTSAEPANSSRSFANVWQAAVENADSRIFAGLHFRFSCDQGLDMGKKIGTWVHQTQLRPKTVPSASR